MNPSFLKQYHNAPVPWGEVGYVTFKRTYARLRESGRTEEWHETVERCVRAVSELGPWKSEELEALYDAVFNLKCCFSGRALWQLGTPTVARIGADSLQNCWFFAIRRLKDFGSVFNQLMLGGGVGFSVRSEHIYELPPVLFSPTVTRVESDDVDFIVPDNREGWVQLLNKVLDAYFVTGKNLTYSTRCIRAKGMPIKSFGGVASGSENLVSGIASICKILDRAFRRKLTSIDVLDICNIIGSIVVAGNVRRSAEIALADATDLAFLDAKNFSKQQVPNWRSMSNNSVVCNDINELLPRFWEGYNGEGESCGLINIENCKHYGRIIDGRGHRPDLLVEGVNPCAEIGLESGESCNLAEIFLPNISSVHEFAHVATLMQKVVKLISCMPFSDPETQAIVERNHRLGTGVTGVAMSDFGPRQYDECYKTLEEQDKKLSSELGVSRSVKLTTVKPSGTLSLLAGVPSGVHAAKSEYYIRRIRFASSDQLVEIARKNGFHVEPLLNFDGSQDYGTMVVEFPVSMKGAVTEDEMTAIDQLEIAKFMQTYWADNAVSVTVTYEKEELPAIQAWCKDNFKSMKSLSFLAKYDSGFKQMPLESIDKDEYDQMMKRIRPINSIESSGTMSNEECNNGVCPVR